MLLPPQHIGEGEQGFRQPFPAGGWGCLLSCCWRQGLYRPGTAQGGEKDGAGHGWSQLPAGRGEPGSVHLDFFLQNEQDVISQIPVRGRISLLRDG